MKLVFLPSKSSFLMTIDQLFRAFTDIEFQYTRFIKTQSYDHESLEKYDRVFETIRLQGIKMDFSERLNQELETIGRIDLHFEPKISFLRKIGNFFTFGRSKKKYIKKSIDNYYIREIYQRNVMIQSIQSHLNEE